MTTANKKRAAGETLLRLMNASRKGTQRLTLKTLFALLSLQERYSETRKRLEKKGGYEQLTCECKLDVVILTASHFPFAAFKDLGYRVPAPEGLWRQRYSFVTRLKGTKSIREINVEHGPNKPWLPPFRITIIPRDASGVVVQDFQSILELLPDFKIVLLEVALDFPLGSLIDVDYVRKHLLSGKMNLPCGTDPFHQRYPGASRTIRAYAKWESDKSRWEMALGSRFLRGEEIEDIFDFQHLGEILAPKYVLFARLNRTKVLNVVDKGRFTARRKAEIRAALKAREGSLWETLRYLRQNVGLKNTQRYLIPLTETNDVVKEALKKWAAVWPTAPTRLGKKAKKKGRP
jgi:hypothetical protein